MKFILTALFAAAITAPLGYSAEEKKCDEKCKEKKESTLIAGKDGDKCKDGDCKDGDKKKEEGTIAKDCDKCKDGEKKKEEGTLAKDCDKCKDGDKKKEEGTLA